MINVNKPLTYQGELTNLCSFSYTDIWFTLASMPGVILRTERNHSDLEQALEIEVGQTWLTREGQKVKIIGMTDNAQYPFLGEDFSTQSYTWQGRVRSNRETPGDLVSLYVEPKPEAAPQAKVFKIGQSWRTRENKKAVITGISDDGNYGYPISCLHSNGQYHTHTIKGSVLNWDESTYDLIELISEPNSTLTKTEAAVLRTMQQVLANTSNLSEAATNVLTQIDQALKD